MSGSKKVRRPREEIEPLALEIKEVLEKRGSRVEICGSLRRKKKTVGDIDIVTSFSPYQVKQVLEEWAGSEGLDFSVLSLKKENAVQAALTVEGVQVDVRPATVENWGAMTLFLTGSAKFNVLMRNEAKKQGLKLNQYGLWDGKTLIAGRTEDLIFYALGYEYLEPELREVNWNAVRWEKKFPLKQRKELVYGG